MPIERAVFDLSPGLTLSGWCEGRALRLVVTGELDLASAPDLTTALEALVEPGMAVTLDLDAVRFVDTAGVQALRLIAASAAAGTWSVAFVAGDRAPVRRTLTALGPVHHLPLIHL